MSILVNSLVEISSEEVNDSPSDSCLVQPLAYTLAIPPLLRPHRRRHVCRPAEIGHLPFVEIIPPLSFLLNLPLLWTTLPVLHACRRTRCVTRYLKHACHAVAGRIRS